MIIRAARFYGYEKFDNFPQLQILVDKMPSMEDLVYRQTGNMYWAEKDGYVSHYNYVRPDRGFGGRQFDLKMIDGSVKTLIGPWHAGERSMYHICPCHSVHLTEEIKCWERGYTFFGCSITTKLFQEAAEIANCTIRKAIRPYIDTPYYTPMPKCAKCSEWSSKKVRIIEHKMLIERLYLCESCTPKDSPCSFETEIL
jgi:hypothetical protein